MREPILAAAAAMALIVSTATAHAQTPPPPSPITKEATPKTSIAPAPPRQTKGKAAAHPASHSGVQTHGIIIVSGRDAGQRPSASRTAPVTLNPQPLPPDPPPIKVH